MKEKQMFVNFFFNSISCLISGDPILDDLTFRPTLARLRL
jgi:hypothetical protein